MSEIEPDQTGLDGLRWRGTSRWNTDFGSAFSHGDHHKSRRQLAICRQYVCVLVSIPRTESVE